jgi:hypothetical protein
VSELHRSAELVHRFLRLFLVGVVAGCTARPVPEQTGVRRQHRDGVEVLVGDMSQREVARFAQLLERLPFPVDEVQIWRLFPKRLIDLGLEPNASATDLRPPDSEGRVAWYLKDYWLNGTHVLVAVSAYYLQPRERVVVEWAVLMSSDERKNFEEAVRTTWPRMPSRPKFEQMPNQSLQPTRLPPDELGKSSSI